MTCYQISDLLIKVVAFGATAIGVWFAYGSLQNNLEVAKKNSALERSKWLNQLFEKFFEKNTYGRIRQALDYNKVPNQDYVNLKDAVENKTDNYELLQEEFVNYLNLFEYVATLWKNKQIETDEVHMLFGYYLKSLERHSWVMAFANENDFKNLSGLIEAVKSMEGRK